MTGLILHHFDASPYAEKARVLLGIKALAWDSVQIPMVSPKPDLTALTGGYRKTPVLQVGADVYCDTSCIARELERRHPRPSLWPDGGSGLALALAPWGDRWFEPGAGLAMSLNELPDDLLRDRREFFTHMDFDAFGPRRAHLLAQVRAHAALVEAQLADGRPYLTGSRPGLADATAWYPLWMARGYIASTEALVAGFDRLLAWEGRVRALGHGQRREIAAADALAIARASTPEASRGVDPRDPLGLAAGTRVAVTPDDYGKIPVEGELVSLDAHEVAVLRRTDALGDVVVHFPRIGYLVEPA
jgi:glutathione S-transferase